jgi:hypothetical protein
MFLRLHEAASRLFSKESGITGRTLAAASRAGTLKTYKRANKTFTTEQDVADWMQGAPSPRINPAPRISAPTDESVARARAVIERGKRPRRTRT